MKRQVLAATIAVLIVACAIVLWDAVKQPEVHIAYPSNEIMKRPVNNCNELAKEIEDMGQVTAEIRKVLRDMEYLTCALPNAKPKETVIDPGPKPDCSPGEAVPYYGIWTCVSVPK